MATILKLRNNVRRLDRLSWNTQATLAAMKRGQALHLHHSQRGPVWYLTSGRIVPPEVTKAVIANKQVADVGDGLFRDSQSQTWRWIKI